MCDDPRGRHDAGIAEILQKIYSACSKPVSQSFSASTAR
jgi:hypothetical protein